MKEGNKLYWIWLSERFGAASKSFSAFADKYDDPYDVYRLESEEIEQLDGVSNTLKARLSDKSLDNAYSILKYCKSHSIDIIGYSDKRYPKRLKAIEAPPVMLYCMGKLPNMDDRLCIGVVGTRKMSEYGKQSAYRISYELACANVCVVSGMALGVDGVSACGALEAGACTVAVLGSGLDVVYPKEHDKLMRAIAKRGAVISEYPPFERPIPSNFPKRNRIISGLCQGILVVEGAKGSGALITAERAIAQGRELFAIPGNVDESNSEGPNELIRNGANVALGASDIIEHYEFLYHDAIDRKGYAKAKKNCESADKAMEKYGVVSSQYRPKVKKTAAAEKTVRAKIPQSHAQEPVKQTVKETYVPDRSEAILASLDDTSKKVFGLIPDGTSFSPDAIAAHGVDITEVITALTMLEISGLVSSLPGGMYLKK
ncbi:MAG: DNA-protecting protein DprA [Ruminococcaceae bacterium]|nr:DNA-protecting protein DprA [Oscillospiraceae bacterium]